MATAHRADEASADHESSHNPSWVASLLGLATAWIVKHPHTVLWSGLGVALLSIAVVISGLEFKTSRLDLLNPNSEFNQRWLAYLDEFGEGDDAIIVAQGPDAAKVREAIDSVAAALERPGMPVESVLSVRDLSALRAKGLHYLSSKELQQLDDGLQKLTDYSEKLGGLNELLAGLSKLNAKSQEILEQPNTPAAARTALARQYQRIITSVAEETDTAPATMSPAEIEKGIAQLREGMKQFEPAYLTAGDGKIAYVLFRLQPSKKEFARGAEAIGRVRRMLTSLGQRHPDVKLGLTGMPVLEFDEMKSSQNDMSVSTWLSLAGVGLMFWASYGGLRHTGVAIAVLLLGMAWAFGYLTLAVGHLNILSVSFTAILVGGGIDFSIHYVAHYLEGQSRGQSVESSLIHTARDIGPGVITGGVTTAMAFMTTSMTDFIGVAELGLIAGGGLLLCLLATIIVLPALLVLSDRGRKARKPKLIPVAVWSAPSMRMPYGVLVLTLIITAALAAGLPRLKYDDNLLNLQSKSMESVKLERDILSTNDRSLWFAVSTAGSAAEARALKVRLEALDVVDHVEEPGSLLPESGADKRKRISRIASRLSKLTKVDFDAAAGSAPDLVREVQSASRFAVAIEGENSPGAQQWKAFGSALANLAPGSSMNAMLRDLQSISRPEPPDASDIPRPIAERCIGRSGKFLMRIYPKGNIWDREELTQFVRALEKIDPQVTGHPVQTFYAAAQMRRAYTHASIYSLIAVSFLLLIDFGSITNTMLAMLPICFGIVQMFGAMGWLGIPLNPANMIALPLILGIGVDDGVHLMHDYKSQKGRYRLANSTALAVMLTSATSMVGFAATILSPHQGLRTLGQALTLGIFTCLASSLWPLPALLRIISSHRPETTDEPHAAEADDDDESLADGVMDEEEDECEPTARYVPPPHKRRKAPILQGLMSEE